jgi:transcriptional regulator with XRE-family HTH domain
MLAKDDVAQVYQREFWLAGAVQTLVETRRQAGLTQAQLALRLDTTQSAIARLERGNSGISLGRYIDYLHACGAHPCEIKLEQETHDGET